MWVSNQLSNLVFVLRSGVKNFSWVGNITNNPFDRCFSSATSFSEDGPFRAKLTFAPNSRFLLNMHKNAKDEPFPSVAGHILRSIFKEENIDKIGAAIRSGNPITMLHEVVVEIVPAVTQTFALDGSDINIEMLGTRLLIKTVCLLSTPTVLKTWKLLNAAEKTAFIASSDPLIKKQYKIGLLGDDVYRLREYKSIKDSDDGSEVIIPVKIFADGSRYDVLKTNKTISKKDLDLNVSSTSESTSKQLQGFVDLPMYYSNDSEITIEKVTQPDAFMSRPEAINQLKLLKDNESAAIFVTPTSQKLIKYDKKPEKTNSTKEEVSAENGINNLDCASKFHNNQSDGSAFVVDTIELTISNL